MSGRTISLPRLGTSNARGTGALDRRQVRLTSRKLGTVILPWWPDEIAWANMTATYEEQARPGRRPLLLRSGIGLEELRIGTVIRPRDLDEVNPGTPTAPSVASMLDTLREMSRATLPLKVSLAARSGSYRITDLGITELEWDGAGAVLVAEISLTLTQASDAVIPVGPVKGKGGR